MATLPSIASLTGPSTTNAQQKTNFSDMRTFMADLLGTDSGNKAAARAALGVGAADPGSSLASSGYQKLPSGLIINWGSGVSDGSGAIGFVFPATYPTAFLSATLMTSAGAAIGSITASSRSGFNIQTYNSVNGALTGNMGFYYISVGI